MLVRPAKNAGMCKMLVFEVLCWYAGLEYKMLVKPAFGWSLGMYESVHAITFKSSCHCSCQNSKVHGKFMPKLKSSCHCSGQNSKVHAIVHANLLYNRCVPKWNDRNNWIVVLMRFSLKTPLKKRIYH